MMKLTILLSVLALCSAATVAPQDSSRLKRGIVAIPAAVSYSSQLIHHAPAVPVAYHATPVVKYVAPLPAVKIVRPYAVAKYVAPAVSYTKVAYPGSVFPYHGYGYGFGHYH